ncbi:MAG TPA: LPS export ABC transporter periplasmic protein LptC [Steroidobacteraceae bacterium]|nr:LPS export ABC transporter periplasmic protein LptC [Steroidobacteraceae bacterium]
MRRAWLLLAFAVALVMWLWRSPREEVSDNQSPVNGHAPEPGYIATGALLFETDTEGQPLYRLRADRIAQPSPTADIELSSPQFEYQGTTVWTLNAHTGVLPPSAQQISLSGDVYAQGQRPRAQPIHIHTATLNVDMQTRHADTTDPVTMDWGTNRLWSQGLHADMQTDHLRLISPVYGEFTRSGK